LTGVTGSAARLSCDLAVPQSGILRKMTLRSLIYPLVIASAAIGCSGTPTQPFDASRAGVNASVRFVDLEGGCWTIAVHDTHYEPLNLPAAFKRDGLPVRVAFRQRDDYGSVCQVGQIVEILSIQPR